MKPGTVLDAKIKLEDIIRKERRDKKVEEVRRPLLSTPTGKRCRQEAGDWHQQEDKEEDRKVVVPVVKTPLGPYLVYQSLEERRNSLKKKVTSKIPDMSSSPTLKPRRRALPGRRVAKRSAREDQEVVGRVRNISKMFEMPKSLLP